MTKSHSLLKIYLSNISDYDQQIGDRTYRLLIMDWAKTTDTLFRKQVIT